MSSTVSAGAASSLSRLACDTRDFSHDLYIRVQNAYSARRVMGDASHVTPSPMLHTKLADGSSWNFEGELIARCYSKLCILRPACLARVKPGHSDAFWAPAGSRGSRFTCSVAQVPARGERLPAALPHCQLMLQKCCLFPSGSRILSGKL